MSFFSKIKDSLSSLSGNNPIVLSAEAFQNALKGYKNVTVKTVRPDAVDVCVKPDALPASYTLRLVATDSGIFYETYVLNTDQKAVKAACEKAELQCREINPDGIVVTGVIPADEANTSGTLKTALKNLMDVINTAFMGLNLTDVQLNARHFDCESFENAFKTMPGFTLKDEYGYINYIFEPKGNIGIRRSMYVRIEPTLITIGGGQTTYNEVPFKETSREVKNFNASSPSVRAFCENEYELYFQTKINLGDFTDAELASKPLQVSKEIFNDTLDAWLTLLPAIGLNPYSIDKEALTAKLKQLPIYDKTDDDGDSRLEVPPTKEFDGKIFVWVMFKDRDISLSGGLYKLKSMLGENADFNKLANQLQAKFADVVIKKDSDSGLRIKSQVTALDIKGDVEKAMQRIKNFTESCCDIFEVLMKEQKVDMRRFDKAEVLRVAKSLPGFAKEDDGDVRLNYAPTDKFTHSLFTWIYIYNNKIKFDSGFSKFTDLTKGLDLAKAAEKFNSKSSSVAEVNSDKKYIRINSAIERSQLPDNVTESKLKEILSREAESHLQDLRLLADICGIPAFAMTTETIALALRTMGFKDTKEYTTSVIARSWAKFSDIDVSTDMTVKMKLSGCPSCDAPETAGLIKDLNKIGDGSFTTEVRNNDIWVTFPSPKVKFTSLSQITGYISSLKGIMSPLEQMAQITQKEITRRKEKEYEERKHQEEERKRKQEEQRELNVEYWMELDSGSEVRFIQKTFNEWFPYLRLGIYMDKTRQAADKYGETITAYDLNKTMRQIRTFRSSGRVTIYGKSTPADVERIFRQTTGLIVKVCYTDPDNHRYYIAKTNNFYKKSLYELNKYMSENGYYYNDWY